MEPNLKGFVESNQLPKEYFQKISNLKEYFLDHKIGIKEKEKELETGVVWAFFVLNQLFENIIDIDKISAYFNVDKKIIEEQKDIVMDGISLFDERFLLSKVVSKMDEIAPLRKKLIGCSVRDLENIFNSSMKLYNEDNLESALYTFLALQDFVNIHCDMLSADEFLGYNLDTISMIGQIYWDKEDMEKALQAFQYGIQFVEAFFDDLKKEELDFIIRIKPVFFIFWKITHRYNMLLKTLRKRKNILKYYRLSTGKII